MSGNNGKVKVPEALFSAAFPNLLYNSTIYVQYTTICRAHDRLNCATPTGAHIINLISSLAGKQLMIMLNHVLFQ